MSKETAFLGIAEGLKSGDNSALERLYKDKCDMAISYLITTFGLQESDAYDVVAGVFAKLPESIKGFEGNDSDLANR